MPNTICSVQFTTVVPFHLWKMTVEKLQQYGLQPVIVNLKTDHSVAEGEKSECPCMA